MGSNVDLNTISFRLDEEIASRWAEKDETFLRAHVLKASWALLLARLTGTQMTSFAVIERLEAHMEHADLNKARPLAPHVETWEISESSDTILADAAQQQRKESSSRPQFKTGVVIRERGGSNEDANSVGLPS